MQMCFPKCTFSPKCVHCNQNTNANANVIPKCSFQKCTSQPKCISHLRCDIYTKMHISAKKCAFSQYANVNKLLKCAFQK